MGLCLCVYSVPNGDYTLPTTYSYLKTYSMYLCFCSSTHACFSGSSKPCLPACPSSGLPTYPPTSLGTLPTLPPERIITSKPFASLCSVSGLCIWVYWKLNPKSDKLVKLCLANMYGIITGLKQLASILSYWLSHHTFSISHSSCDPCKKKSQTRCSVRQSGGRDSTWPFIHFLAALSVKKNWNVPQSTSPTLAMYRSIVIDVLGTPAVAESQGGNHPAPRDRKEGKKRKKNLKKIEVLSLQCD